jgi:acyl-CoA dehydrogenase
MARAIGGGFAADRVAWAFAAGYQAALHALQPDLAGEVLAAFCVTEESGRRPRDMRTTITRRDDGSVAISGAKRWTTLGPDSSLLLVVGRMVDADAAADDGERPQLRVARVPAGTPGLSLIAMPATRFVPEVPHARVQLDDVRLPVDALLPGDGYETFVKPFRTLEDMHVTAAVLAYLLREARARDWPTPLREQLVATLAVLVSVAAGPVDSPATHVALEGALLWAHRLYEEAGKLWDTVAEEAAVRWRRDTALFEVAGSARAQRAARAWERLSSQGAPNV